ncbi:MAG: polysaccharide biosynthesis/export family protein [Desulfocapsaceae bacterium]|nr:polysaccharide biosynthesis/export family protein [Desulfocapsaceae bacterium]
MKKHTRRCIGGFIRGLTLFIYVLQLPLAAQADEQKTRSVPVAVQYEDYTIGAGDILEITVWKNEELSKKLPVRPDGKISLPLVGEIMVEGKKVKELSSQLQEMYSRYVTGPIIYLSVQQVNSMNVYIIGRVNTPGVRPLISKTNVLQGLAMAAGLTPFAEGNHIKIFRTEDDGTTSILEFDYDDVSRGRNLQQNILLKRGDVIVVP